MQFIERHFRLSDNPKAARNLILLLVIPPVIMLVLTIMQEAGVPVGQTFGIRPRSAKGLLGLILAPWAHYSFLHYGSNMMGWAGLAPAMLTYGILVFLYATGFIAVVGGLLVWAISLKDAAHAGLSGVLFGYLAFLLTAVIWQRPVRIVSIVVMVVTMVLYGSLLLMFVNSSGYNPGVSWESHVFGFISGVLFAWLYFRKFRSFDPQQVELKASQQLQQPSSQQASYAATEEKRTVNLQQPTQPSPGVGTGAGYGVLTGMFPNFNAGERSSTNPFDDQESIPRPAGAGQTGYGRM
uniref:Peptidase S54 rhomboid domain-containing protein n=1 Tax=Vitrella brassicaformis TaxID=1169539 RepID=A0A7S1KDY5_9ALVE|mmetsp:Transcript_49655/g.124557  ORF Transcript_49655/g.124557 Transcript_49655/m.124557 type:complete len:295 (+) Transcript_49655:148-1032(+)